MRAQQRDGLIRIDAIGTTAVGDDLTLDRHFRDPLRQFVNRDRAGAGEMPGSIFFGGPDIKHDKIVVVKPIHQRRGVDRFQTLAIAQIEMDQAIDLSQPGLTHIAKRLPEAKDLLIREAVEGVLSIAPHLYKLGAPQRLQMLGCIRDRHRGFAGELLDISLPLGEQIKQLKPVWTRHRFTDAGELLIEQIFELTVVIHTFNRIIEYVLSQALAQRRDNAGQT